MARYTRNPAFEPTIRREPRFQNAVAEAAEPARDMAEKFSDAARAPWMPRRRSGSSRTIEIVQHQGHTRIVAIHYDGHLVEFGSTNNPPHAPLRRGARAAGLRLTENPKT